MTRIRAGVFGVGGWARRTLLPALDGLAEVVGGVDPEPGNVVDAGIPHAYDSVESLFDAQDVDLLVVAAPDHVHVDAVRAALGRGIAVYCEKPCGNSAASIDELARVAGATPATVGYSFRYSPAVQALRRDLTTGALGDVWLVELFEHNPQFHPTLGRPVNWKGDPSFAVAGSLLEYGSHVIDLGQWLLGPIAEVSANLIKVGADRGLDDIASLQLRFDSGVAGTLLCGWVLAGGYPGITIRVHTSEGLAEVALSGGQRYRRCRPDGTPIPVPDLPESINYAHDHLRDLLGGDRGTLPTLGDAARVLRVVAAALRATARWQSVTDVDTA
ncbi:MAG TPA: Gfo/Idh/MocA family oxidoreductase [Pseudonocardiaceae bacterium]|nr:Gfo/Idh/MocA family oxidoreductase [Pseudonocardiaceae bacterium]